MRRLLAAVVFASFASLVACTVQNTPTPGGASSSGGSSGASSGTANVDPKDPTNPTDNTSSSGGSSGSSGSTSGGVSSGGTVEVDGTCSAFQACGGNPQGTYDYTGGCIADVFKTARDFCSEFDTSKAVVKVKGNISFNGAALERNATVTISGDISFPESCVAGQCAAIETELRKAFDSATCSGSSSCSCTIVDEEADTDATTYTIQGGVVTTADGDEYSICENGADLSYSGKSAGSEQGSFTLKKR